MKSKNAKSAHQFPEEEISIDELIERLVFIEKLERRIYLSEKGTASLSVPEC